MANLIEARSQGLADEALDNLVHQFARPLDFLRELVQNAIDAGTPRVEVWTRFESPPPGESLGVLEIHVDDFGEGMDEAIIDSQLTRLFSSTKEDDLTKIGKFGIGFTSIFAIEPDAILLRTGRHGEAWELLFHADRSFDKVRADAALVGTQITLYKRMAPGDLAGFVREARWVLSYWCEHSNTPVLFGDRSGDVEQTVADGDDPFAAFAVEPAAAASELKPVTSPMDIDATLVVRHERDGVRVVIGHADEPHYGFYNGGLTLLSTDNADALGSRASALSHLAFKVKYDRLEHTLTRDNVLQDRNWDKAVDVLFEAAAQLRELLMVRAVDAASRREDMTCWHGWLADECVTCCLHEGEELDGLSVFLDRHGQPLRLIDIERQEDRLGAVLIDPGEGPLADALERSGVRLLPENEATWRLLSVSVKPPLLWFIQRTRTVVRADELYLLPGVVGDDQLDVRERRLLASTEELVGEALGRRHRLRMGDFGGVDAAGELPLAMESPDGGEVCRHSDRPELRGLQVRRRTLVLNRHHAALAGHLSAAEHDLELASFGLAQALLVVTGVEGKRRYRRLLAEAIARHDAAVEQEFEGGQP